MGKELVHQDWEKVEGISGEVNPQHTVGKAKDRSDLFNNKEIFKTFDQKEKITISMDDFFDDPLKDWENRKVIKIGNQFFDLIFILDIIEEIAGYRMRYKNNKNKLMKKYKDKSFDLIVEWNSKSKTWPIIIHGSQYNYTVASLDFSYYKNDKDIDLEDYA